MRVNGAVIGVPDDIGSYPASQYFGAYPAGTPQTIELQYQLLCATETLPMPAGRILLVPYLAL